MITNKTEEELKIRAKEGVVLDTIIIDNLILQNPNKCYKKLMKVKTILPKDVFGLYLRKICQSDTEDFSYNMLRNLYKDLGDNLMRQHEIDYISELPNSIEIYRGTENEKEILPRISWSLDIKVAQVYAAKHLFKAIIPKDKIIAYYSSNEKEVIAFLQDSPQLYELIY